MYRSFQDNLEKEQARLLHQQELKADRALHYAEEHKRQLEDIQTKRQLITRRREEAKKRHEQHLKAHLDEMQRTMRLSTPTKRRIQTASTSPKRLKVSNEDTTLDLLRNIEEKMVLCSKRSGALKQNYMEKLKKHSEKVNQTMNLTMEAEVKRQNKQLLKVVQKHSNLLMWSRIKGVKTRKTCKAAKSMTEEKLQRAFESRSELQRQTHLRLTQLEEYSQAKLKAACEASDAFHRELTREKTDKQLLRRHEQLENYGKQLKVMVIVS